MLPLSLRKEQLGTSAWRGVLKVSSSILLNAASLGLRAACKLGLEGLVSKRRDRPYQAGRSKYWVKVKNRSHPAMEREL